MLRQLIHRAVAAAFDDQHVAFWKIRGDAERVLDGGLCIPIAVDEDDIVRALDEPARIPADRRRNMQRVSRHLQLLRAHGLIQKVPHCHRYQVTFKGKAVMTTAIHVRANELQSELTYAA